MGNKRKDIETLEDVQLLVNEFYGKIRKNPLLQDIFNQVIQNRWPEHLAKMYTFWQTVLLDKHTYFGRPLVPHIELPVVAIHFEEWIKLWYGTLDELFEGGPKVDHAKWQSARMAEMFQLKIQMFKGSFATQRN